MFVRAYLRASTTDQDANRAKADLEAFAAERGLKIAASYTENESGAKLDRPMLFRLLDECQEGDILLVEQVDRLTRLNASDWQKLKGQIAAKRVRIVALDLPTSWQLVAQTQDEFTSRMLDAINDLLTDVLAATARKDYLDRKRRIEAGVAKGKVEGRYTGRPEDTARNAAIMKMLANGQSWNSIIAATKCSRSTLSRLSQRLKSGAALG